MEKKTSTRKAVIDHSWIAALVFFLLVVLLGCAMAEPPAAKQVEPAIAASFPQRLSGTVACAAQLSHEYTCRRNETRQSCVIDCVQSGSHYVLLVGEGSFRLSGARKNLDRYAGGKAIVTGVVKGGEIEVSSTAEGTK
jgi:hypothetical protein